MSAKPTSDALNPIQPGPQGRVAESRIYKTPSFNYILTYRPGKDNVIADVFSRKLEDARG